MSSCSHSWKPIQPFGGEQIIGSLAFPYIVAILLNLLVGLISMGLSVGDRGTVRAEAYFELVALPPGWGPFEGCPTLPIPKPRPQLPSFFEPLNGAVIAPPTIPGDPIPFDDGISFLPGLGPSFRFDKEETQHRQ